jgi:excisionase family DNA binding protein
MYAQGGESSAGRKGPHVTASPQCLMVTVTEAAQALGVSPNTLKRAGEAGEIPMRRIRSVYLLPAAWLADLTAWPERKAS